MRRQNVQYPTFLLIIALAVGIVLSSNARMVSHDLTELAQIVAEHDHEVAEHGHAHNDIVDLIHAYHGHMHDVADHDHNIAFLPPRAASSHAPPTGKGWAWANGLMQDRSEFDLDRPPRL